MIRILLNVLIFSIFYLTGFYSGYNIKNNHIEFREKIEAAYFLGCIQGVDQLIRGEYTTKTCKNYKYFKEKK